MGKPLASGHTSVKFRELILGKDLLDVTLEENLLTRGNILLGIWEFYQRETPQVSLLWDNLRQIISYCHPSKESYWKLTQPRTLLYIGEFIKERESVVIMQLQNPSAVELPLECTEKQSQDYFKNNRHKGGNKKEVDVTKRNAFMAWFGFPWQTHDNLLLVVLLLLSGRGRARFQVKEPCSCHLT